MTADNVRDLEKANGCKEQELSSLRAKLELAEQKLSRMTTVELESRQKDIEVLALQEKLIKMEHLSQQISQVENHELDPIPVDRLSQGTILALQGLSTPEFAQLHTVQLASEPQTRDTVYQTKQKADCTDASCSQFQDVEKSLEFPICDSQQLAVATYEKSLPICISRHSDLSPLPQVLRTQDTTSVPETQVDSEMQIQRVPVRADVERHSSSSLSDVGSIFESSSKDKEKSTYFPRKGDVTDLEGTRGQDLDQGNGVQRVQRNPTSATKVAVNFGSSTVATPQRHEYCTISRPPSSSYGETMLLEDLEQLEDVILHPSPISGKASLHMSQKDPSPRRLRSASQARPARGTPLRERTSSERNIQTSPEESMRPEKHRPNSAAKRRLESDERSISSSLRSGSKRLRRDLSAVEVKNPAKSTPASLFDKMPRSGESSRLNHPSMPIGSRKGGIIAMHAPAPGVAQQGSGKRSRKGSKNDRYSARFGQEKGPT